MTLPLCFVILYISDRETRADMIEVLCVRVHFFYLLKHIFDGSSTKIVYILHQLNENINFTNVIEIDVKLQIIFFQNAQVYIQ